MDPKLLPTAVLLALGLGACDRDTPESAPGAEPTPERPAKASADVSAEPSAQAVASPPAEDTQRDPFAQGWLQPCLSPMPDGLPSEPTAVKERDPFTTFLDPWREDSTEGLFPPSIEIPGCLTVTVRQTQRRGGTVSDPPAEAAAPAEAGPEAQREAERAETLARLSECLPPDVVECLSQSGD